MPVQARVIPLMRAGKDLIVKAVTGSGKTGAFGIPLICELDPDLAECQALVMAPTRELANQVCGELEALGKHKGIRCVPIYGGVGYAPQIEAIEAGAHVIVGTPGRLLDHLGSGRLDFDHVKTLVVDEADELLALGFWPDMREINSYLPKSRQSCLFSATIPEKVRSLSRVFLNDPEFVSMSDDHDSPQAIEHFFVVTTAQEKDATLVRILEDAAPESALIFCNIKADVGFVTSYLTKRGCAGKAGVAISLVSGLDIGNFRYLQQVNKIQINERPIPTEESVLEKLRKRLTVKVEQEVRGMSARDRKAMHARFIPVGEGLMRSPEGMRDLAAICSFYVQEHKPETTVPAQEVAQAERSEPAPSRPKGRGRGRGRGRSRGGRR